MEATARQDSVLATVVQEYVRTAQPIASEAVLRLGPLRVSSATVRNDMAELEERGLVRQPHTSAGRVPTELGYRYYVEHIMRDDPLPLLDQRRIRHQFHQVRWRIDEWPRLVASVLAQSARNAGLITPPRAQQPRLAHFDLLPVQGRVLLLVAVLKDGAIRERLLSCLAPPSGLDVSEVAGALNPCLADADAATVATIRLDAATTDHRQAQIVGPLLEALQALLEDMQFGERPPHYEGMDNILSQPEFTSQGAEVRRRERITHVLHLFSEASALRGILAAAREQGGVHIVIGSEPLAPALRDCSLVLARFGQPGGVGGVIGVLGPTRMAYARTVSSVRYVSQVMDELLEAVYG